MATPYYLTPAALAQLRKAPALVQHEKRFPISVDRWRQYEGSAVDALEAMFVEAWAATPQDDRGELLHHSPAEVLAAVFGDPDGEALASFFPERTARRERIRGEVVRAMAGGVLAA